MCGRFSLHNLTAELLSQFGIEVLPESWRPRYNVAPSQLVFTISQQDGQRVLQERRWGLVPSWAKDPKIGYGLINARSETVADKPSFRSAFKRSRCLVLADGFYEWRKDGKAKQPFYIRMKDGKPFAFAGLSEHWDKGEKPIDSATIITTEPNPLMAPIHDRMPVILLPEAYDVWLDPEFQSKEQLQAMLQPFDADQMEAFPVSTLVSSPKNEKPECVEPV